MNYILRDLNAFTRPMATTRRPLARHAVSLSLTTLLTLRNAQSILTSSLRPPQRSVPRRPKQSMAVLPLPSRNLSARATERSPSRLGLVFSIGRGTTERCAQRTKFSSDHSEVGVGCCREKDGRWLMRECVSSVDGLSIRAAQGLAESREEQEGISSDGKSGMETSIVEM